MVDYPVLCELHPHYAYLSKLLWTSRKVTAFLITMYIKISWIFLAASRRGHCSWSCAIKCIESTVSEAIVPNEEPCCLSYPKRINWLKHGLFSYGWFYTPVSCVVIPASPLYINLACGEQLLLPGAPYHFPHFYPSGETGNLCIILKPIVAYLVGREHAFSTRRAFVCGSASFKFSFIAVLLPTLWPIISCNIGHPRLCDAPVPFAFLIPM